MSGELIVETNLRDRTQIGRLEVVPTLIPLVGLVIERENGYNGLVW